MLRPCFAVCVFLLAATPALAQLGTATISGNVTDATGAVVVGASIRVVNTDTGFRRETRVNDLGQYNVPGLSPGRYEMTVEMSGFKKSERKGLILQVDQNARLDMAMEIGQVTEVVEITGQAPLVESQNATLGRGDRHGEDPGAPAEWPQLRATRAAGPRRKHGSARGRRRRGLLSLRAARQPERVPN